MSVERSAVLITNSAEHAYIPLVLAHAAELELQPGHLVHVQVLHDDWCALLADTGPCNCEPEVRSWTRSNEVRA